jgi:Amt family ammonium transporter
VTTLGGASGILGACLFSRVNRKTYDFDSIINGALAGLVAVTAGSVIIRPWAGLVLGSLGGITYALRCVCQGGGGAHVTQVRTGI